MRGASRNRAGALARAVGRLSAAALAAILGLGPWAATHAAHNVVLSPTVGPTLAKRSAANTLAGVDVRHAYDALPLLFVENRGQLATPIRFYQQSRGATAAFTASGVFLSVAS